MTGALDQAQKTPWRYGFLNLMRRVDAQLCDTPAGSIGSHGWKNSVWDRRRR